MNNLFLLKRAILFCAFGAFGIIAFGTTSQAFGSGNSIPVITALSLSQYSFLKVSSKADGEKAQKFIAKMGDKAISFLSNEKLTTKQKEKEFRKLLNYHFDMKTIGRFALGRNWKVATGKQKTEYQKLFKQMIVKVYTARFNEYKGQSFDVASVRDNGKKDALVTTYIIPDTGSKVKVDWRVRNKGGKYKVIDVIIEGVSMSLTQRSDFSSVIQRGGGKVEVLLEHLRK